MRQVGIGLLGESETWTMPGPEWAGRVVFYEDFPYAWWSDFRHVADLPAGTLDRLPLDVTLQPDFADITDQIERKITGIGSTTARSVGCSAG